MNEKDAALRRLLEMFKGYRDAPMGGRRVNSTEVATIRKTLNVVVSEIQKELDDAEKPMRADGAWCINCFRAFDHAHVRHWFGADDVGPFCVACRRLIAVHSQGLDAIPAEVFAVDPVGPDRD